MRILHGLPTRPPRRPTVLTIGNFDGVHLGHQALIRDVVAAARGSRRGAGVMTFDPHPLSVLAPHRHIALLSSLEERLELLSALRPDFAIVYPFTWETARTPAREFLTAIRDGLCLSELWVGPDFKLGRGQDGSVAALGGLGEDLGFEVRIAPHFCVSEQAVHSSQIRELLDQGDVAQAARFLGRPYSLTGTASFRPGNGSSTGCPIVIVTPSNDRVIPGPGIYSGWAEVASARLTAVICVAAGADMSRESSALAVQACLLDYSGPCIQQIVKLSFGERLHPDVRFDSVADLLQQMASDVADAQRALEPGAI
jgi:riboflavin kinase/FMN adenylyltransferase